MYDYKVILLSNYSRINARSTSTSVTVQLYIVICFVAAVWYSSYHDNAIVSVL